MPDAEYMTEKSSWVAQQLEAIDEAGSTEAVDIQGRPVIVVTMRGARSGKLRRVPLMRVEQGGAYAAVASKGGSPEHPVWYHNLLAHPQVQVLDGRESHELTARVATGQERAAWWERAVLAFPSYADYQRSTDREIPVFILD